MSTLILTALLVACGPKKAPEAPAQPAVVAPVAEAPAPEPVPEPEPAPAPNNADLQVTLTFADGTSKSGQVVRIERSEDFFADAGWTTADEDLRISADGGNEYKKLTWQEVSNITIKPGNIPADVDCLYDSDFSPWMYDCTLKTTGTLTDTSGNRWTVDNRHKWRMTFSDDTNVEFWLKKHAAREQDSGVVDLDTVNPENRDLYVQLQQQLRTDAKGSLVVSVRVQ
ncbi:MAG: hypothetical protein ACI8RZ_004754 [Myxococcota bacterium]